MREQPNEALGAIGGVASAAGRHGDGDLAKFSLDRRREPLIAAADERIETRDRSVQAVHGRVRSRCARSPWVPMCVQPNHVLHVTKVVAGSDTACRRPQPTRTLVTGARRRATSNHPEPASAEPNTSPFVAPK
jgi:hypothetical protein